MLLNGSQGPSSATELYKDGNLGPFSTLCKVKMADSGQQKLRKALKGLGEMMLGTNHEREKGDYHF